MTPEKAFGQILKKYRTSQRLSQEKLALECDLDRTFISLLERGKRQPSLGSLILISERLGITASKMVKYTTDLMKESKT